MMDEYDKCSFCKKYDDYEGCRDYFCPSATKDYFEANVDKIIEKAKEKGISIADLVAIINIR